MFTFKQKLLFTLITSLLSSSVFAAPQLFNVVAKDPNGPDTPLLRSLQNNHRDYQLVKINQNVLLSRSSSFLFKPGENGQEIEIKAISLEKDNVGNDIWRGKAENDQGEATFSVHNGKINGGISLNDGSYYEIYPVANDFQALMKIDAPHFHDDSNDVETEEKTEVHQHALSESQSGRETLSTDTTPARLRVLYLYTDQTRPYFVADPVGKAGFYNDKLNVSYDQSDTYIQFDIAGVVDAQVDETNTTLTQIQRDMREPTTALGKMVAAKRAETHADLVTMITFDGELCGIARLGGWTSAVHIACAVNNGLHSLPHEIGHNFGLGHNEGDQSKGPYAYGYRVEGKFRTIMSEPCASSCFRINRFSTPLGTQDGLPMGTAAQNDAVRFLREVRFNFSDTYPYWDSQYQLTGGDLPAHQYFEINLTERQTNKTLSLDKKVTNTGQWTWPFEIASAVNGYFPKGIVEAGQVKGGAIIPVSGSSYLNHIWLHQDKKNDYQVSVQRKTYAVVNGNEWGDVTNISGGEGLASYATVVMSVKEKSSGKVIEQYFFNNGTDTSATSWPAHLARIINTQKSSNVIAGELKDGNFIVVAGSGFRNRIWFPLAKKHNLAVEFTVINSSDNPWLKEENAFGDKFQTDLASGSVVTVTVKNSDGTVAEQQSVAIPDGELSRYDWPPYLAHKVNANLTQIKMAEKTGDNSFVVIAGSQYRNYMWKKDRANQTVVVTFNK